MSHISELKIAVRDVDAADAACRELGVELRRNQKTFKNYGNRQSPCDMAICVPGAGRDTFEAGLIKQKDGSYLVQMDNWQGGYGLNEKIGANATKFLQAYGVCAAEAAAKKQGMVTNRHQQPDGTIRLVCEAKPQYAVAGRGYGSGY